MYVFTGRLATEFKTIEAMVRIYCHAHHKQQNNKSLCTECSEFISYANEKLDRCPYGQNKPACNKCPIHCYKNEQRIQAKEIMHYAGPRMLLKHPILAGKHIFSLQAIPTSIPSEASNRHQRNNKK